MGTSAVITDRVVRVARDWFQFPQIVEAEVQRWSPWNGHLVRASSLSSALALTAQDTSPRCSVIEPTALKQARRDSPSFSKQS